jgi:sugar/nucleoside kinase (ribokinase family)
MDQQGYGLAGLSAAWPYLDYVVPSELDAEVACPAFSVPVVDTTGAGDNFVGGLVHALVHGFASDETLRFASAVAALSLRAVGAGAGFKDLRQVEHFLSSHSPPIDPGS